jgi:hypothetical protein
METLSSWRQELSLVRGGAPECKRNTNNRKDFGQAIIKDDADVVGQFLADDWIIIDPVEA